MKKIILYFLTLAFLFLVLPTDFAFAQNPNPASEQVRYGASPEINFFYSAVCPHCVKEKEFLKELKNKYPEIEIKEYETFYTQGNREILEDFYNKYQVPNQERGWVPTTFTPDKYFVGFNEGIGQEIENCLKQCINGGSQTVSQKIKIPFFGTVDISKLSLPVLTLVLGLLDGFNPCAMWVLIILISILLPLRSRKRIALVGGIFIFVEGFLYFLFMTAWLNIFLFTKNISLIRILIGVFGIGFGVWRIRDFILWKPGVCKVTNSSKSQEKFIDKARKALNATTLPAIIIGVTLLALGVNLIEFFCSAGFPVIFTRILALQNISGFAYYLYLFFYNILYMLDDILVFAFAFFTLGRFGFSEKYNKYSTLVAGLMLFILGILLIFRPEWLMFG